MLRLFPIVLYLVALFIAPQLWVPAFALLPVDYFIYPLWLIVLMLRGRFVEVFRFRAQDLFFVGMLVWIAASTVINTPVAKSGQILSDYFKWFLLYRMVAASVESIKTLRHATWAILLIASVVAIEAIQHLTNAAGTGWAGQSFSWVDESAASVGVEHRTKWVGIFDGPGVFCVMFTVALPFALALLAKSSSIPFRILGLFVFVPLLGGGIFSTGSRGGFLTAIAMAGFWILSRFRLRISTFISAGVIAAAGILLAPAYLTSVTDSHKSAQHRVDMWVEGIEAVQQNPIFGIGKGRFAIYTGRLIAHNSSIEIMAETGLIGLFFWLGITYFGLKNLARRLAESEDVQERELILSLGLCIIGYLISSLFVTLEYETLYFLLGLTAAVGSWTTQPASPTLRDVRIIGCIAVALIVLIKFFVMLY
jgi:O-antigen ligase